MRDEILYERKKLPVWTVVKRSYGYVWESRGLLAVPCALLLAFQIVSALVSVGLAIATAPLPPLARAAITLGWPLLCSIPVMSFTVGLHRTVLLDEIQEGLSFLRWNGYLRHYVKIAFVALAVTVILTLLFTAALVLPLGIANMVMLFLLHPGIVRTFLILASLAALYLWIRVSLALPAAALGYRDVFSLSWRLTAGNALQICAAFLLVYLPFLLPNLILLVPQVGSAGRGVLVLLLLFINVLTSVVWLSLLTVASSLAFFLLFQASDDFGAD